MYRVPEVARQWDKIREQRDYAEGSYSRQQFTKIVESCQFGTFLDISQEIFATLLAYAVNIEKADLSISFSLLMELEELFLDRGIGYKFSPQDRKLVKRGAELQDQVVEEARILLKEEKFRGPDEQFKRALDAYNKRPEPDLINCIKDAVGAIEGVARILSGKEKAMLPAILDAEPFRSQIHPTLRQSFEKLNAYRGDMEGVAHGQTRESKVTQEEARLILGMSASAIIYLAEKFGKS